MRRRIQKGLRYGMIEGLVLLIAACGGNHQYDRIVAEADSILHDQNGNHRTAMQILDSLRPKSSSMTRSQRMRFEMVYADGINKNYIPFTSDSILTEVADYYQSYGSANEQMKAYYLLGCVYRDRKNIPMTLKFYQKAIECADTANSDCDYDMLFRIHGQCSEQYALQRLPDREMEELEQMQRFAWLAKDTLNALYSYAYKKNPYFNMGKMDSVLTVSQKSSELFQKYGFPEEAKSVWNLAIYIWIERGELAKARKYMDVFESRNGLFDEHHNIVHEYVPYYAVQGFYYLEINQLDSAEYFFRKFLTTGDDFNTKEGAYKGLFQLYQKKQQTDSVVKYANLYCETNDSALRNLSTAETQRIRSMYDFTGYEKLAYQKTLETTRARYMVFSVLLVALATILSLLYYMRRRKQKSQERIRQINQQYTQALNKYGELHAELENLKENRSLLLENKQNEIKKLRQILASTQEDRLSPEKWNIENAILSNPIIQAMHKYAETGDAPESLWQDFEGYLHQTIPQFLLHINQPSYRLSEVEHKVCLLIRLRFLPSETANLLKLSSQRLTNIRTHINQKLFNARGTKGLDTQIRKIPAFSEKNPY